MSGTEFNHERLVTARLPHQCEECRREIGRGERYSRTAAVWEYHFFTNVACLHCRSAREIIAQIDPDYRECYYGGGLAEWIAEGLWYDFDTPEALRVAACFKARWRYQSGHLMPVPPYPGEVNI